MAGWRGYVKERGLKMDIKKRIDALTEQEAKAALDSVIMTIALLEPCRMHYSDYCPYYDQCNSSGTSECAEIWLDEALKEARK